MSPLDHFSHTTYRDNNSDADEKGFGRGAKKNGVMKGGVARTDLLRYSASTRSAYSVGVYVEYTQYLL